MNAESIGVRFARWAQSQSFISLLVLIGSQARGNAGAPGDADCHSDWDFQLATSAPAFFKTKGWTSALGDECLAYVFRQGRLGSVPKVTALCSSGELDLVIIPLDALQRVSSEIFGAESVKTPFTQQAVTDLATVLSGGFQILKGDDEFGRLYGHIQTQIQPSRLSNEMVCHLAEGFVCDYVSTMRKIDRGELLAGQRWLHHHLAETNFRLLQELQRREGRADFPDARRLEIACELSLLDSVRVNAAPTEKSLHAAVTKSAETCRSLVRSLVGDTWQWPRGID